MWVHCTNMKEEMCQYAYRSRNEKLSTIILQSSFTYHFYRRPVLAFGYCHRLHLCVCVRVCVCQSECQSLACLHDNSGPGFEISNWMHLSIGQVDCKNHLSECTIHLSEIYKANATYVKIRNTQLSIGQVLQVFHLSDCHFYSSQTIGRVKFRTLGNPPRSS